MKVFCAWCQPRRFLAEKPPFDNPAESDTICDECREKFFTLPLKQKSGEKEAA